MRRILLVCLIAAAALVLPSTALAVAPTVTLTAPANGGLITGGQPAFSGSAADAPAATGQVTISISAGPTATGAPVQVLDAPVSRSSFTVSSTALADGTYTAVASESNSTGQMGTSQPVTFRIFNGTPELTLTAPPAPIQTPAPTLSGTAETGSSAQDSVSVAIYPGSSTDATPLALLGTSVSSSGAFSVQVQPGLADGTYTAVAAQQLALSTTYSKAVTFTITGGPPSLSITAPALRGSEPQTGVDFAGSAGSADGDDAQVGLRLYTGTSASGTPIGTETVNRNGSGWSETWPTTLALGSYTLQVSQSDSAGQTSQITRSFQVRAPGSVDSALTISAAGRLSVRLACLAGAGTCNGDVLILTARPYRTAYGGPLGPLALMFDHYSVSAAHSTTLTARLSPLQLTALRRAHGARLKVIVAYALNGRLTETSHVTGTVKVG